MPVPTPSFSRPGRGVAVLVANSLVLAGSMALAPVPASAAPPGELRPIVLDQGHIDLFELTYDDEAEGLELLVKDDTDRYDMGARYREPDQVSVLVDTSLAAIEVPDLDQYSFLGDPGDIVYYLPEVQDSEVPVPWPGLSTERLPDTLPDGVTVPNTRGSVAFEIEATGPGEVLAWDTKLDGDPNVLFDTADAEPDQLLSHPDIHAHFSWAFTEVGDYELVVTPKVTTTDAQTLTGEAKSYHFHVGARPDDLSRQVDANEFGASITGVPTSVGEGDEVDLAVELDEPHPEVAGYQWYRSASGEGAVEIPDATGTMLTTTVDPWDSVYAALLDASGRILTVAFATFPPMPATPIRPVVLNHGHIDMMELTYDDESDQLDLNLKDDTDLYGLTKAYRDPSDVTIAVDQDVAKRNFAPGDLGGDEYGYGFIPRDQDIYWLDMNQEDGLPWAGWSTERLDETLPAGTQVAYEEGTVQFAVDVQGPGDLFQFGYGAVGEVDEQSFDIDTTDEEPDVIRTTKNTHEHTNWVFTEAGDYLLTVTPTVTTTTGGTLTGPPASYHVHIGPALDLPEEVDAGEFGASITGVPDAVTAGTDADLELVLDEPRPEVAGYQWYQYVSDEGYVEIQGGTGTTVSTTVDPYDFVSVTILDESGRILSAAHATFYPAPSVPGAAPQPYATVENDEDVRVSWGTPDNGNSPITRYVARLRSAAGQVLSRNIDDEPYASELVVAGVPAGTWTATVQAINALGTGPESVPSEAVTVEPSLAPGDPDTAAVPEAELTEEATGDVAVLGPAPYPPGTVVSASVGTDPIGTWVSAWLHADADADADPVWVGWVWVDEDGIVDVTVPADAALGAHRLVIKSESGELLGWTGLDVGTPPVTTSVSAGAVRQVYGRSAQLTLRVTPQAGGPVTGPVSVRVGSRTVSGTVDGGRATVTLPARALAPGRRSVAISYAGVDGAFAPASGVATVQVVKAKARVTVKALAAKVARGQRARIRVAVDAAGVTPGGKVLVRIGGLRKVVALGKRGQALVKLVVPRSMSLGVKTVVVDYHGDAFVAGDPRTTTKIRVIR